jgi:hypothetical protein
MEIKLFGKSLFEFKTRKSDMYFIPSVATTKDSKILPDFKKMGSNQWGGELTAWSSTAVMEAPTDSKKGLIKLEDPKTKPKLTPKRVYDLKMLHDQGFRINMDSSYIDSQIKDFKDKLGLMNDPGYNFKGFNEIGSILLRMENRKKYATVKSIFEKFPYTTNSRIDSVIKKHDYLQLGEVDQFVADMPNEATAAMKEYNDATTKVCDKKAVFYIIADKKDFQKTSSRRDPILLAQSPFGHFWQILGAWDKECLFLEEL